MPDISEDLPVAQLKPKKSVVVTIVMLILFLYQTGPCGLRNLTAFCL
jgi:hypothetical protein